MPYISEKLRLLWKYPIKLISDYMLKGCTTGELNFIITSIIHSYVTIKGLKYQTLNDVVGVLESAKAEFQRTVVAEYEDEKIEGNGAL